MAWPVQELAVEVDSMVRIRHRRTKPITWKSRFGGTCNAPERLTNASVTYPLTFRIPFAPILPLDPAPHAGDSHCAIAALEEMDEL